MSVDASASHIATHSEPICAAFVREFAPKVRNPNVLELGTKRSDESYPTHHKAWVPHAQRYVMSDFENGTDVDVIADAHNLVQVFERREFDIIIACSVWEHLKWPWVCAEQVYALLKPGGLLYVQTHHAFPVHGYPCDYGRWTDHGLDALFEWAGFYRIDSGYAYPAQLIPPSEVTRWNTQAPVWLNVEGLYRK